MPIAGVVADANVLLSAVIGKAALRVFEEFEVPVHTTLFNRNEVLEYLPRLAGKYRLVQATVELQLELLALRVHPEEFYKDVLPWARATLGDRDPDDAHPLALSRTLDLPLWSNDRDLQIPSVRCYTTAALLKVLTG
ncbi:MAG TPA: PIN domain-containing protein [Thermoanaerobaculia bacterium]|jgi:predicted nucleic acid-binding protein|nr:PIN domain-containing protein [Thermoanaerobaculia bacterium]